MASKSAVHKEPAWWTSEYDSAWDRVKEAMKRDWDQTKHHFGGDEPDTDQSVRDTMKQAAGKEPIPPRGVPTYEDIEPAFRYGYGARLHYGDEYPEWDDDLETHLEEEWMLLYPDAPYNWNSQREFVRQGWTYNPETLGPDDE